MKLLAAFLSIVDMVLRWPPLLRTLTCPVFQSMSSSSRNATSPERNPNRASKSKIA
jgi:hypothetical protein